MSGFIFSFLLLLLLLFLCVIVKDIEQYMTQLQLHERVSGRTLTF